MNFTIKFKPAPGGRTGYEVNGTEGLNQSDWVLVDCFSVIVHFMMPAERAKVDLENLWQRSERTQGFDAQSMSGVH